MIDKLVRRALKRPHFRIVQSRESLDLTLTVQGSVPHTLKEENTGLYRALFRPKERVRWVEILMQAYSAPAPRGKKPIKLAIQFWIHKLLVDALSILLSNAKDAGGQYESFLEKEIESLAKSLRRKPGPHKSRRKRESDAVRFAVRHKTLIPEVSGLKEFIRRHTGGDDKLLGEAATEELHYEWLSHVTQGQALQNLPMINGDPATARSHLRGKWAPWQLSVGIIWCEEKAQHPTTRLGASTVYKYILQGNKILQDGAASGKQG
jgi:hypothetical protein